ncbi:MAG: GDSL-type esterase/lipase family protein [Prevotella sp.]|nr:GDSL-type esterase/lipase family protein [Prevotella sp.]
MKKSRIISVLGAAALCLLTLSSCGDSSQADAAETTAAEVHDMNTETSYKATAENVKLLGRTYFNEDKLYCALSGTGAEFSFTGTKCTVNVSGDSGAANASNADNQARVGIYVNGERVIDDMVDNLRETYDVFESDTPQDVTVSIVKLSESPMSTIAIGDIKVTGSVIKPTADKDVLIEFIGDSITCGYGADDPVKENHFSTKTEDVTKAYAYKTAQLLDADYSMVSFSGYGIISGYSDGKKKVTEQQVPKYYTKLGYSWASNGSFVPASIDWDFTVRRPDVVVVNLGTNDDSYTGSDEERQLEYSAAYVEFLKTIREKNPDAKILCTLGIMGDRLFEYVQKAADDYTAETGDKNIYTMKFDVQSPDDGYSADWHPSVTTHDKAAAKLSEEIKKILAE